MPVDLSSLATVDKLLFDVPLTPVQGHRFQPTGFPDLGAATFETKDGTALLVESAQSMANRLEATCWDDGAQELLPELRGLSYVRVNDDAGTFLTSSVLEAHRINSAYIEQADKAKKSDKQGAFHQALAAEIGYDGKRPIDRPAFIRALFRYDVGSLVHGAFLESIGGRLRVARAMGAFIEADGVRIAASGGVKNDNVMPGTEQDGAEKKTAEEGFGNVLFHRDEYTAESITLFANIDLAQIRGYGLGEDATKLLTLLCLFKLRTLLDGHLRLRTACDFTLKDDVVKATNLGFALPSRPELLEALQASIRACAPLFTKNDGVTTVTYAG